MTLDYESFLISKRASVNPSGFDQVLSTNPKLFAWQADIVRWALKIGKAALFADCGLGKSFMQLEWAYHVHDHTQGDVLILAPLSVGNQTKKEGIKLGIDVNICRTQADVKRGINITNYEMLKHFDWRKFSGVVLDESSILKNMDGKTKRMIVEMFESTPYKLACTATPAPNDYRELGNHAEFLNVMREPEMLARWFINDTMDVHSYRLKGHAQEDFWRWVASWSVCMSRPSDLGYSDEGFVLPPLNMIPEVVDVDITTDAEDGMLFRMPELSATSVHKEGRMTCEARAERIAKIVGRKPHDPWAIWCETNYEADAISALIPEASEVRGSEKPEVKAKKLEDFSEGRSRILIVKPKIASFGLNWQHCADTVIARPSYSYESIYQLICRFHRFRQEKTVNVHMVMAETEHAMLKSYSEKQQSHNQMRSTMSKALAATGLSVSADRRPGKYRPETPMILPQWLRAS